MNTLLTKDAFPVLRTTPSLLYLDTAASALTPQCVIDAVTAYDTHCGANVARGLYPLSTRATDLYEKARADIATLIGAQAEEVIFTSGTTHALNIVAAGTQLCATDTVIITRADHHANFLPWQRAAEYAGAQLRIAPLTPDGTIDLAWLRRAADDSLAILALPHVSNVLGVINPIAEAAHIVRTQSPRARIVLDAAQSIAHMPVAVDNLDCDFLAFSGHKCYGPTGIGVLWGRSDALRTLTPFCVGGEMVERVTDNGATYKAPPHGLEAGTPPIAQAIGLGAAMRALRATDMARIRAHDTALITHAITQLMKAFGNALTIYGTCDPAQRCGLISFSLRNAHPHDVADIIGTQGVCMRAGAHCAQPLHTALNISATLRMSFGTYTTTQDIDRAINILHAAYTHLTRTM